MHPKRVGQTQSLDKGGSSRLRNLLLLPRCWWETSRGLRRALGALLVLLALGAGYTQTGQSVTLVIDGQPHQIRTHQRTVGDILQQMGITLETEDHLQPPPGTFLATGETLSIRLARPVVVEADGDTRQLLTHLTQIDEVLAALDIQINPRDEILYNGQQISPRASLPDTPPLPAKGTYRKLFALTTPRGAVAASRPAPVRLIIHRSVPVVLQEGQTRSRFYSARSTVGEALLEQGITLFLGDRVTPGLGMPLSPGMRIFIQRSTPVTIKADGRTIKTRTHGKTVGQVLAQEGVALMGQDYSQPAINQPISANDTIQIVRVHEAVEIEEEFITFETQWVPDDQMEIDRQEIRQAGATGVIKTRTRVRYENGEEVWRTFEDEWLDQEPSNRVIAYGTRVVVRTLETEEGPVEYWRRISMRASAYNAASSGKAPDHPRYGLTRTGRPADFGVVAVDPRVIPLNTRLYIEDYGPAVAGDTGSRILGKHIDLGYPDGQPLPSIFGWRDVYVLTPVPPENRIRYVLPQWPQQ